MTTQMVAVDYTVEGAGEFPFDMLRYDQSFPKDENESSGVGNWNLGKRRVILTGIHHPGWVPAAGRWESFGWRVVAGETSAPRTVNG